MRRAATVLLAAWALAACGSSTSTPTPTPTLNRPSSPVKITLVSPTNGEVIHGTSLHVVVRVQGGTVTKQYSTHVVPTVGHVHLYFNNQLVYMAYTLQQDMPVQPGLTYSMYAEWVAADHLPFNPRDVTPTVIFTVAPAN